MQINPDLVYLKDHCKEKKNRVKATCFRFSYGTVTVCILFEGHVFCHSLKHRRRFNTKDSFVNLTVCLPWQLQYKRVSKQLLYPNIKKKQETHPANLAKEESHEDIPLTWETVMLTKHSHRWGNFNVKWITWHVIILV